MKTLTSNDKNYFRAIVIISIAVPLLVSVLFFMPQEIKSRGINVSFLPALNAIINSTVSVLLIAGLYFVKNKNIQKHRAMMLGAFSLSALFLISYVAYHTFAENTKFGGEGTIRYVYFFILLSHIILAAAIVPLVLITIYRSTTGQIEKHRKIAKWTFPLWLYVSITGVLVYLLISPYYVH